MTTPIFNWPPMVKKLKFDFVLYIGIWGIPLGVFEVAEQVGDVILVLKTKGDQESTCFVISV